MRCHTHNRAECEIHCQLDTLYRALVSIQQQLNRIEKKEDHMSKEVDDLVAEVAEVTTVEQSALTLIQGIVAAFDAAKGDAAKVAAATQRLKDGSAALAAAVAANTPAAEPSTT